MKNPSREATGTEWSLLMKETDVFQVAELEGRGYKCHTCRNLIFYICLFKLRTVAEYYAYYFIT